MTISVTNADWYAVAPLTIVAVTALVVLLVDLLARKNVNRYVPIVHRRWPVRSSRRSIARRRIRARLRRLRRRLHRRRLQRRLSGDHPHQRARVADSLRAIGAAERIAGAIALHAVVAPAARC